MRRIRIMMLGLLAMFAFSAVVAGAAEAAPSPNWTTKENGELLAGNTRAIKTVNTAEYKLTGGTTKVACVKAEGTGALIGGKPGTDLVVIFFKECHLEGKTLTECYAKGLKPEPATNNGEIVVALKTMLIYPKGKLGATKEILDAFFPEGEGKFGTANYNLYTEFELNGTNCGTIALGSKFKVTPTGSSTEVTEPAFKKKCGLIAEVGKLTAGNVFETIESGKEFERGALNFPATPITEGEVEAAAGGVKMLKCKLEFAAVVATQVGTSLVKTVGPEEFGWKV